MTFLLLILFAGAVFWAVAFIRGYEVCHSFEGKPQRGFDATPTTDATALKILTENQAFHQSIAYCRMKDQMMVNIACCETK